MPRILPAAASILALGLTSIVAAQHGPAKVAAAMAAFVSATV